MSHFAGLVITTQEYLRNQGCPNYEESLEKYDEGLEYPEYKVSDVSDWDKVRFIKYYRDIDVDCPDGLTIENDEKAKQDYADLFKEKFQDIFNDFEKLYKKHGEEWNGNNWRKNPITDVWEVFSTYNPNSKWDWYVEGGRWNNTLKMKGKKPTYVNSCKLGDIDWTNFKDEDYYPEPQHDIWGNEYRKLLDNITWHFTQNNPPFALVVDGNWVEKGDMGWWGMTSNEMSDEDWSKAFFTIIDKLPKNSIATIVDFHI